MSSLLERINGEGGFNPALDHDELADTHIRFRDLGADSDVEMHLDTAIRRGSGIVLVVGPSGGGKSSLIAFTTRELAGSHALGSPPRRFLPLYVPVAARGIDAADLRVFGQLAIRQLLSSFGATLKRRDIRRLERGAADAITRQPPSVSFNPKLTAKGFGLGGELGAQLAGEIVSITTEGATLDEHGGLTTLAHTVRGHEHELVIVIEDTDAWTITDEDQGRDLAREFFGHVVAPLIAADLTVVVAAQTHWDEVDAFQAVAARAAARVELPTIIGRAQAVRAVACLVQRRASWALGREIPLEDVVTESAVEVLAARLGTGSFREPLTLLRDALGRLAPTFPDRLDRGHLLEAT